MKHGKELKKLIKKLNRFESVFNASHYINLVARINGQDRVYEFDFIKDLRKELISQLNEIRGRDGNNENN